MSKLLSIYHFILAWAGSVIYTHPSRKLFVLGVTGTKGKSTTLEFLNAILETAGKETALSSTVRRKILNETGRNTSGNSMPGRFFLQKFLRKAVQAGAEYALIEVTSQGAVQHRHKFIDWNAAVFTNLAPEHIESHGGFENYRAAKVSFFEYLNQSEKPKKLFFVNKNDPGADYFIEAARNIYNSEIFKYSKEDFINKCLKNGLDISSREKRASVNDWLWSDFNLENAAAGLAFSESQNIPWPVFKEALLNFKGLIGRMEFVRKEPFAIIVDGAHTPDSLEKAYQNARPDVLFGKPGGKMICILGAAGGGRDKWKRPAMGKIAAEYCDTVILTDEDPYDENPDEILNQVENGFNEASKNRLKKENVFRILDRKEALKKAAGLAMPGDSIIATGKGSEMSIHIANNKTIPWDEKGIIKEILGL